MTHPLLLAKNITKVFRQGEREVTALKGISLEFLAGEFTVIWGSSGSGKSSLLSILAGLDQPSSGEVWLAEKRIDKLSEDRLAEIRKREIGFVFQSFHLIPVLNAVENVALPLQLQNDPEALQKSEELLKRVGLSERLKNFPHQLSGGEQQRVAIARALVAKPKILFADEPTGNLDAENGQAVLDLLLELQSEQKATLIMVSHEVKIAEKAARIVTLEDGQVVRDERPTKM